jgi:putative Mg2+ transporter-C (MgtC) family protein
MNRFKENDLLAALDARCLPSGHPELLETGSSAGGGPAQRRGLAGSIPRWLGGSVTTVQALAAFDGQGWLQIGELLLAAVLSSTVGLERQLRGKSAGLRTQAIVGTTAALILLVSKYGFSDVLAEGLVVVDPSRVAAQIVSGVGFLGAGMILTRHGAVRGLTTAAAVWETAGIGMAAAAGLWLLALVVTAVHFVVTFGYSALLRHLPGSRDWAVRVQTTYLDGQGVLREVLAAVTANHWRVYGLLPAAETDRESPPSLTSVALDLRGSSDVERLVGVIADIDGVHGVRVVSEEDLG